MENWKKTLQEGTFVVGLRQVCRELQAGRILDVFLSEEADEVIKDRVKRLCEEKSVEVFLVDSSSELGQACNIERSASVAGRLRERV